MKNRKTYFITQAAAIAALYVVMTYAISTINLASGAIQLRISECLTILPFFTPAAVPGLFIGCLISNMIAGANGSIIIWDIIFGSIATLLGAVGTYALRKYKWLTPLPPILANTIIVPFILAFAYQIPGSIFYFMLTVGIGEILSCGVLGLVLLHLLLPYRKYLFTSEYSSGPS